jgi:ribonuclease P protein component
VNQCLGKTYKLCSKKRIQQIFEARQSIRVFPFTALFLTLNQTDEPQSFQVVFSVPKRIIRKAHERNHLKRLMREALRKNKVPLETFLKSNGLFLNLFLIYSSKEEMSLPALEKKINRCITELIKQIAL